LKQVETGTSIEEITRHMGDH